jgi:predicted tellurium resistance membrane protein TerC
MEWLTDPQAWAALVTLTALEIVLGIDNIIFILDSVITAVGMAEHIEVMVIAIVLAVGVMLVAAGPVSAFADRHPALKMLALSFLVEMLNLRPQWRARQPVALHHPVRDAARAGAMAAADQR